jgi:phosphoglycerate dehydrogenase-like enzyme
MSIRRILVAVDDFTETHLARMRSAVEPWGAVETLPQSASSEAYSAAMRDQDAVVGWPDPDVLLASAVSFLQLGSSGWDSYQDRGLEQHGVAVCSGRGIYSASVAEHCLAMMFALTRRLPVHLRDQEQHVFRRRPPYPEVGGATACIVGLGHIGLELAWRCKGIGMHVIGVSKSLSGSYPSVDRVFGSHELKAAVHEGDHIFLTASAGAANRGFFSRDILASIRPVSYFYNISRGSNVDEEALYELLTEGRIAGAGLDVTATEPLPEESPLWKLGDNVLITGHSAGISVRYPDRFCALAINNLDRFYRGEPLMNRVI